MCRKQTSMREKENMHEARHYFDERRTVGQIPRNDPLAMRGKEKFFSEPCNEIAYGCLKTILFSPVYLIHGLCDLSMKVIEAFEFKKSGKI